MAKLTRLRLRDLGQEFEPGDTLVDEIQDDLAEGYPGVAGIELQVSRAVVEGDDVLIDVELDPRDYIRQSHALGCDDLQILQDLKDAGLPEQELSELLEWLRSDPDFWVAWIESSKGELNATELPSRPEL